MGPITNDINAFRKILGKNVPAMPTYDLISEKNTYLTNYIEPGKVVLIDFWNTRCLECVDGLDSLEKIATNPFFSKHVIFVAVNMIDTVETAKKEISRWPYMVHLWISREVKEEYVNGEFGLKYLPHLMLIDQQGLVVKNGANFYSDSPTVTKEIKKLLDQQETTK